MQMPTGERLVTLVSAAAIALVAIALLQAGISV
jgi:hypothetical protein